MSISEEAFTEQADVEVRMATTIDDYATAFRMVYDVYYAKGFTAFSSYGMWANAYQMHPSALVLLDGQKT
jgi:hypothetical protein